MRVVFRLSKPCIWSRLQFDASQKDTYFSFLRFVCFGLFVIMWARPARYEECKDEMWYNIMKLDESMQDKPSEYRKKVWDRVFGNWKKQDKEND